MGISDASALLRGLDPVIWVVTAAHGEQLGGLLATFVSSASIVETMPRVVVGIARQHRTWELIEASGAFTSHLLGTGPSARDLASRFGLKTGRTHDKFAGLAYQRGISGSPILDEAAGWLDCRVEARFDTGDRTLFLGQVVDARSVALASVLTVNAWREGLTTEARQRLLEGLTHDAEIDAVAIRAWRQAREGSGGATH
jgi:flavin reductase (DIM6/NTAB) family NADH-FMN oxidoreductase RutF